MNDLRRTLLWSVLAVSLLMLWDGWLRHTGQPSLFAPAPAVVEAPASAASGSGTPSASPALASATAVAASNGASAPTPAAPHELVTITTDVVQATVDSDGATLVKVELLKHKSQAHPDQNMVVLDKTAAHTYVAETGLIGGSAAQALPNHTTPFVVVSQERTLADGAAQLELKLASVPVNGVKLVKTYTFKRGDYAIGVKQEVVNASAATVHPQLYVQLTRDGSPAEATKNPASFMGGPVAYTGMAVYNAKGKYQKLTFEKLAEGKAEFEKLDDNGWVAMVQHHFASAWLQNDKVAREFYSKKLATNLYATGMLFNLGDVAAGQSKAFESTLFVGPQEENKLKALAPGLEYTKDYGWTHIMAAPLFWLLDKIHGLIGNWGWAIVALVVLLKAAFYWLNASAYRSMAKMKALNPRIQAM
ncbi:MAG TPA: membrane protein insertase YidC, partial [Aquabacterium sp.]|nr:membrane protein insertase YidC [Aquabacterium sp.]